MAADSNPSTATTSPFLRLPYDVRYKIYDCVHTPRPVVTISLRISGYSNSQTVAVYARVESKNYTTSLISLNKQLYNETFSILCSKLELIINDCRVNLHENLSYPVFKLDAYVPLSVLKLIRKVTLLMPTGPSADFERLPDQPFPFALCPNLRLLRLKRLVDMTGDLLFKVEPDSTAAYPDGPRKLTRAEYGYSGPSEKLECWKNTGLLDPQTILDGAVRSARAQWVSELVSSRPTMKDKSSDDLSSLSGIDPETNPPGFHVPQLCRMTIWTDYRLLAPVQFRFISEEVLSVEVDVKDRKIIHLVLNSRLSWRGSSAALNLLSFLPTT